MSTYEVIHDPATGEPLASVCLRAPITDEERAVLVEYFLWQRERKSAARLAEEENRHG